MAIGDSKSKEEEEDIPSDKEKDRESERVKIDQEELTRSPLQQTCNPGIIPRPSQGIIEGSNIEKPSEEPGTEDGEVLSPIKKN